MDTAQQLDQILDKFARDLEASVHAFYRGDVRQDTQRSKREGLRAAARQALLPLLASSGDHVPATPSTAIAVLAPDEVLAATRCVMGWLPMGPPSNANAQSRCVPAARELAPTWGEREKARAALRRSAG